MNEQRKTTTTTNTRFRSSSASIQAAINDPRLSKSLSDLSLLDPLTNRGRNQANRALFEKKVRRYFYQLTTGCGDPKNCNYSLCASNNSKIFSSEVAAAMAVQLASNQKLLFCPRLPQDIVISRISSFTPSPLNSPLNSSLNSPTSSPPSSPHHSRQNSSARNPRSGSAQKVFSALDSVPAPFLNSLFSFPSFSSLFSDSVGRGLLLSDTLSPLHISRSRSANDLHLQQNIESSKFADTKVMSTNYSSDITSTDTPLTLPLPKVEVTIGLSYLTLDLLKISVDQYHQTLDSDTAFLLNSIKGVFSSVDALSKSFMIPSDLIPIDYDQDESRHPSGLDISSICAAYQILQEISTTNESVFHKTLVHAIEILLMDLHKLVKANQNPDNSVLRVLLIVILNPLLLESDFQETMVKRLCVILGRMRSKANSIWITWLSFLPSSNFLSILTIFKNYTVSMDTPLNYKDESLFGSVKSMSLLCTANELHTHSIIPYSEFYLHDFVARLNFKEEYKRWRKSLEKHKVTEFALFNYPFLFDPVAKARIMHIDAMVKMSLQYEEACVTQALVMHTHRFLDDSDALKRMEDGMKHSVNPYLVLGIRRSHFVADVLQQVSQMKSDLKKPLKIKFVGGGEEGMDQGGVQKEFFQCLMSELLDPSFGMFCQDEETRFSWINSASLEANSQFELVGILLGLALYNGVIVRVGFPPLLYKKLLKEQVLLEDVEVAFPALGRGLRRLLDWSDGDVSDVFMRTFEISYENYGKIVHIPLIENGSEVMVTNANRQDYVRLYIKHLVDISIENQFRAFQRGFYKVCGGRPLAMCRPDELELLICGKETDEIEFHKLEEGAEYDDGYSSSHTLIRWFWEIVHHMNLPHKRKLLEFVTASDRVPIKGLGSLTFVIQRNGPDTDRLPSALTCFGRLLLPEYCSKEKLQDRLTTAIENAKGFGLV